MATWILIMTACYGYSTNMATVVGFSSAKTCEEAGNAWKQKSLKDIYHLHDDNISFTCTQVK